MKKSKGKRIRISGWITLGAAFFFVTFIARAVVNEQVGAALARFLLIAGILLIITGHTVEKHEAEDPKYSIPRNVFKIYQPWQLLMIGSIVALLLIILHGNIDKSWISAALLVPAFGLFIASLAVKKHSRQKPQDYVPVGDGKLVKVGPAPKIICSGCHKEVGQSKVFRVNNRDYCMSCYSGIKFAEQMKKDSLREKALQTKCSGCGKCFPQSSMHNVNGKYLCEDCFGIEFTVDI